MIIFLRPGEQVEVQFIAEDSTQQPYKAAVVVKHGRDGIAKAGKVGDKGQFVVDFMLPLTPQI